MDGIAFFVETIFPGLDLYAWGHLLPRRHLHLEQVLAEYVDYFNPHRPHRSLHQRPPDQVSVPGRMTGSGRVRRRDRLGGLIHEYQQVA
ncbi:hypothetical protein [Amycolatopsis sp. VC5-11]|uniref:hypothetical protein n=1 Tax=Amycolatopsis sp. VC5-11 TaxID=3120156 RepID=UPI00300B9A33